MSKKISVIIVDDSALIRALLSEILQDSGQFEVLAVARDPYEARELIKLHNPDVITLDIEMPRMNGITFLKNLMRLRPLPVVMISTLTQEGAPATLEALELGAVDFVPKPMNEGGGALDRYREDIVAKVAAAARANVHALSIPKKTEKASVSGSEKAQGKLRHGVICAIGASTGGTEAIRAVVSSMPENSPPIVITQHIPASFSESFAKRVDMESRIKVHHAQSGQVIEPGNAYIAPGHAHLKIVLNKHGDYTCLLDEGPEVNRHKPSVEVMFESLARVAGKKVVAAMLTGMGADGANSMKALHDLGCHTIAQDESSSVVWGMPGAVVKLGGASEILPLAKIARAIIAHTHKT